MNLLQKIKAIFSYGKASNDLTVLRRPRIITAQIEKGTKKLNQFLSSGRNQVKSFEAYELVEQGAVEMVKEYLSILSQTFDSLWLKTTNRQEKTFQSYLHAKSDEGQAEQLQTANKENTIANGRSKEQKRIKLVNLTKRLIIQQNLRRKYQKQAKSLSKKLDEQLNHLVPRKRKQVLVVFGIIVCSLSEGFNALNSLMVFRANPATEIATVIGISLTLVALCKGIVYAFSYGTLIHWRTSVKSGSVAYDVGGGLLLGFSVLFVLFMGELRIDFLAASDVQISIGARWFIRLLGLALFTATLVLSMMYANPKGKVQRLYSIVVKQLHTTDIAVQDIEAQIEAVRLGYQQELSESDKVLVTEEHTVKVENPDILSELLFVNTASQSEVLAMSRQSKKEWIHKAQSLLFESRSLMESKLGKSISWPTLQLLSLIDEPAYQRPYLTEQNKPSIARKEDDILSQLTTPTIPNLSFNNH